MSLSYTVFSRSTWISIGNKLEAREKQLIAYVFISMSPWIFSREENDGVTIEMKYNKTGNN